MPLNFCCRVLWHVQHTPLRPPAYVSCLYYYIHISSVISGLRKGYWITPLLILGFQMLSGFCKMLWTGFFWILGLKFLTRKDLFADDCSFDFVHTKERETFLQCYKIITFIPLFFKISSGIKTERKTKPLKKVNII